MMTVNKVSRLTGVSIRALHYYDQIGLLPATGHTDSGWRPRPTLRTRKAGRRPSGR